MKNDALLRRLPKSHPQIPQIESDNGIRKAGFYGEESLDYYLKFLDQKKYHIFHDLRLPHNDTFFQIDTLLLSQNYGYILDAKNLSGEIFYDETFKQLIQTNSNGIRAYSDPIEQVARQQYQLEMWLKNYVRKSLPMQSGVISSNPATILKTNPNNKTISDKVFRIEHLIANVRKMEARYTKPTISDYTLQKISELLVEGHTPPTIDVTRKYGLKVNDIIKGVQCPNCSQFQMERFHGTWCCPHCQTKSKHAHKQAIVDFLLLLKPTITNQECRDFLGITSRNIASDLLASMDLLHRGSTKGRVYFLPANGVL